MARASATLSAPAFFGEIEESIDTTEPSTRDGIFAMLFHVPDQVDKLNWYGRIAGLAIFVLWTFFIWRDMDIPGGNPGSYFLHVVATPFHEAGHYFIFRWFGEFIMILGGTLGQHLFFIVLGVALLWKRRDPFGAAVFFWGLGFSVADMGVYMYDAFDPKMMLLSGRTGADDDGHDWQNLFDMMGVLKHARGIGVFFGYVGKAMMAAGLAWAAWMVWRQHAHLSDALGAESEVD
ncbi:MAG: hypothetical protein ACKVQK_22575 [Burkholderiales bacterium]